MSLKTGNGSSPSSDSLRQNRRTDVLQGHGAPFSSVPATVSQQQQVPRLSVESSLQQKPLDKAPLVGAPGPYHHPLKPYHRSLPKLLPLAPKLPCPGADSLVHAQQPNTAAYSEPHALPIKKKEKKSHPKTKNPSTSALIHSLSMADPVLEKAKSTASKAKNPIMPIPAVTPIATPPKNTCNRESLKVIPEIGLHQNGTTTGSISVMKVQTASHPVMHPLPQITAAEQKPSSILSPILPVDIQKSSSCAESTDVSTSNLDLPINVETNVDYIALTSALSLLRTQRSVACNDLIQLKKLKTDALENPDIFITSLRRTGKLQNVPKMQRITRAPIVSWKNYGIESTVLDHHLTRGLVERQPAFSPVRLFDDQD